MRPISLTMIVVAAACGCDLPRDPNGTLARVRGGTLRVGVVHAPPWARVVEGQPPTGVEVTLVQELAGELGATVEWVPGGEGRLLEAVERRELDLVIGGLTRNTPWKSRIALTRTLYTTEFKVGGPLAQPASDDIEDREVAVRPHDPFITALVRAEGGNPVPNSNPAGVPGPVVAEEWRLAAWGLRVADRTLTKREHVWAAPPGENGWIVHLDGFLKAHHDQVPAWLAEEAKK